jgi:ribonuclease HII
MELKYPTLDFEQRLWKAGYIRIAGIDEAGRGAWAGPVCAAAVILPCDPSVLLSLDKVRDSKLMTPLARETWAPRIRRAALAWGVGFASPYEIDTLGILPSTKLAALRSLASLSSSPNPPSSALISPFPFSHSSLSPSHFSPDFLITDYLLFPSLDLPQIALVKGDQLSLSISAASVLAKTARDALMCELNVSFPGYGFARHKGYGTRIHQEALKKLGLCEIHRKSFSIQ